MRPLSTDALREALLTLSPDAEDHRAQVLSLLRTAVGAETTATHRIAVEDGRLVRRGLLEDANPAFVAGRTFDPVAAIEGTAIGDARYDPRRPRRRRDLDRFLRVVDVVGPDFRTSAAWTRYYAPAGFSDSARMLVYDGPTFAAYVAVQLVDGRSFAGADMRRLGAVADAVGNALAYESRRYREPLGTPGVAVLDAEGNVRGASTATARWLNRSRRAQLASLVRGVDRPASGAPIRAYLDGADARIVRLDGRAGVRYAAVLVGTPEIRQDAAAALTRRQAEVADRLAAGETIDEAASRLGCSPHTVRSHLRAIYDRLGIATRVELAALWRR